MTFQRTFEVHEVRGAGSAAEVELRETQGEHPAALIISRVDEQLLHALVVSSPDGLVLTEAHPRPDDVLCCSRVRARQGDESTGTWTVELGFPMSGLLRVDRAAFDRLDVGVQMSLHARTPVPAPETDPGWRFALELSDAVQVPFQQVCELGVLVGAAGGTLTTSRRSDAMVFAGPGAPPAELQDWCRNNDVTCAVSASA